MAFSPISASHTRITRGYSGTALYSTTVDESTRSDDGRRAFLSSSVATLIAGCLVPSTANADGTDYKAVAKDIAAIIKADPNKGPTLVRLVS